MDDIDILLIWNLYAFVWTIAEHVFSPPGGNGGNTDATSDQNQGRHTSRAHHVFKQPRAGTTTSNYNIHKTGSVQATRSQDIQFNDMVRCFWDYVISDVH